MRTDNHVGGKYFAELMKEVLSDVEVNWEGMLVASFVNFFHNSLEWTGKKISTS
jgi:hypothetical protein